MNNAINYVQAKLQFRYLSNSNTHQWVITTNPTREVSILGNEVTSSASYSSYDGTPRVVDSSGKTVSHTVYLNDTNKNSSAIKAYEEQAGGRWFYIGVPENEDNPVTVITPAQYESMQESDTTSLQASAPQ